MSVRRRLLRMLAVALAACAGCSEEPQPAAEASPEAAPERPPSCAAVRRAIDDIMLLERDGADVQFVHLDVTDMTAEQFRARLAGPACARRHLWMPGERDWLLVLSTNAAPVSLVRAMDRFADDPLAGSVSEVFASYVGTVDEVLPAFTNALEGTVVPEWFVTRGVPRIGWIDPRGVERGIWGVFTNEALSVQAARRDVLEGNMAAAEAKNDAGYRKAAESWAKAFKASPRDPMLEERRFNLRRNAVALLEAQRVFEAMKCFQTLLRIDPADAPALNNFGRCLLRMGRKEAAEEMIRRAEAMMKAKERSE